MPLKILNALVCDSVRTEDNGKQILVGVYSGDIVFTQFPSKFGFTFWLQMLPPTQNGNATIGFRINAPGFKKPIADEIPIYIEEEYIMATLILNIPPVTVTGPGQLKLSMRKKGEKWKRILVKEIIKGESTSPTS